MEKRFKAIIFDLGGVLSVGKKEEFAIGVHEFVAKKLKLSLDQYMDSIDEIYSAAISGTIPRQKVVAIMSKNLNITPKALKEIYFKAYKKNFRRDKGLYHLALDLKKKGYKIAIISDIWCIAKEALLDNRYYKKFDVVIASCDVGSRKTGTEIFKVALRKLDVSAHEALFTDNQKWNLIAPRKIGVKPILYKNKRQFMMQLKKYGVI
ncbi:MAG: HAD hydrolase-like protein [Candidatus Pacearchaeota archaeon]|nr:HAD hydrolase-like protein [Candidatus Pacearchaeota archaeon]MDE1848553.1 HAD hydrolase-like protein [Nanoarchaeota archaeon]